MVKDDPLSALMFFRVTGAGRLAAGLRSLNVDVVLSAFFSSLTLQSIAYGGLLLVRRHLVLPNSVRPVARHLRNQLLIEGSLIKPGGCRAPQRMI